MKSVKQLLEVADKRTQGEWRFDGIIIASYEQGRDMVRIANVSGEYTGEQCLNDCKMLVAAPLMEAKLREMVDMLPEINTNIKALHSMVQPEIENKIKILLAKLEKWEG